MSKAASRLDAVRGIRSKLDVFLIFRERTVALTQSVIGLGELEMYLRIAAGDLWQALLK
ncbi:MAG: hypothetical protein AABN34_05600 [Acidobacteriota bacterium]